MDEERRVRIEAFISLYKQQMERFHQTQQVEWKGNFGVWTLLAGATYLAKEATVPVSLCIVLPVLFLLCVFHGAWLWKIHNSERVDKMFWVRYRREALELLRESNVHRDETHEEIGKLQKLIWLSLEMGITVILCAFVAFLLWHANPVKHS